MAELERVSGEAFAGRVWQPPPEEHATSSSGGEEGASMNAALSASLRVLEGKVERLQMSAKLSQQIDGPGEKDPGLNDQPSCSAIRAVAAGSSMATAVNEARLDDISLRLNRIQDRQATLEAQFQAADLRRPALAGPPLPSSSGSVPPSLPLGGSSPINDGGGGGGEGAPASLAAVRAWAEPQLRETQTSLARLTKSARQDLDREIAVVKEMIRQETAARCVRACIPRHGSF